MIEEVIISDAKEELKRADHSIYVTLKYTKTADVIKNIVKRLIVAFDFAIEDFIVLLRAKKKIKEAPPSKRGKAQEIMRIIPKAKEYLQLYLLLRRIDVAPFQKREEYRKNVTLIAEVSLKEKREVNIDALRHYFAKTNEFVDFVEAMKTNFSR
ncbi:MAG: hypothetical protein AABW64_01050 [Nanoarchaeota archaeon]